MAPEKSAGPVIAWAAIPLFQSLLPAEREMLRPFVRMKSYEADDVVFAEGEPALWFHFVLGGKVKIVKAAPGGREVILEIFGPGDPVGAIAAYEEGQFPASAIALEATTLLSVPRQEFFALLAENPRLVRGLLIGLTRRMLDLTRRLADRSSRVEYRIARLFLTLAARLGEHDGSVIDIPMTLSRQEIADLAATTQETAIRVMSRWNKSGILLTLPGGFRIPDPSRLESISPAD